MTFAEKMLELSQQLFDDLTYKGEDGKTYQKEPIGYYPVGNGQIVVGTRKEYVDYVTQQSKEAAEDNQK